VRAVYRGGVTESRQRCDRCRTELDMSYLAEIEMSGLALEFWAWKRSSR
jgi:hypothetical protein